MRVIPIITQKALEQSAQVDPLLVFVTITHPDMSESIRLVVDGEDYLIDGTLWHKSFFELDLLTDDASPPVAKFRFPNVDQQAIGMMRNITGPARVSFQVISALYFDTTQAPRVVKPGYTVDDIYTANALFLTDVTVNQTQVEGTLRSWDYRTESWPNKRVTRQLLPGAYAR